MMPIVPSGVLSQFVAWSLRHQNFISALDEVLAQVGNERCLAGAIDAFNRDEFSSVGI